VSNLIIACGDVPLQGWKKVAPAAFASVRHRTIVPANLLLLFAQEFY